MVKVNTSEFLKASDVPGEAVVQFVDEGKYVDSQFKDQAGNAKTNFNITVRLGEDEKTWTMNKTSQRAMAEAYGDESSDWVGKCAKLIIVKMLVGKDMRDVVMGEPTEVEAAPIAEPEGWEE